MVKLFEWEFRLAMSFDSAWRTFRGPRQEWRAAVRHSRSVFRALSVGRGGGRNPYLFTQEDASSKLIHSAESSVTDGWVQMVQYLPSARKSGRQHCRWSSPGCRAVCLDDTGRLATPAAKIAMQVRADLMYYHPFEYAVCFLDELERRDRAARRRGLWLASRPNGTSDIPWEQIIPEGVFHLFHLFDYTKGKGKRIDLGSYYTVASATERTDLDSVEGNVVVPVDLPRGAVLPATFAGRVVIDGDAHDRRDLDLQGGYAVLVRVKGFRRDRHGFIRSVPV